LDTKTILSFTFLGRWLPSTARGPSSFDPFGLADPTTPRVAVADTARRSVLIVVRELAPEVSAPRKH
jgi:hypothetical protein